MSSRIGERVFPLPLGKKLVAQLSETGRIVPGTVKIVPLGPTEREYVKRLGQLAKRYQDWFTARPKVRK